MANDILSEMVDRDVVEQMTAPAPSASSRSSVPSVPLKPSPGLIEHIRKFTFSSFADFYYNSFRFVGYVAQAIYSIVLRGVSDKLYGKNAAEKPFVPRFFRPDFIGEEGRGARMIIHAMEFTAFEGLAIAALFQDRNRFRIAVGDAVAAEQGKAPNTVGLKDILASNNPIIQTAVNRSKGLYILRLVQPLTFLWSLGLALTTMALEIVGERAAYLEKNAYDRLQQLVKEVGNNQLGTWSRKDVVARLVEVIQQSRSDHDTAPIQMDDIEKYFPLLYEITDRMLEKKWRLPEALYVLGQIVKDPASPQKAQQAYNDVLTRGLAGIAAMKHDGTSEPSVSSPAAQPQPESTSRSATPKAARDILARGPNPPLAEPSTAELSPIR